MPAVVESQNVQETQLMMHINPCSFYCYVYFSFIPHIDYDTPREALQFFT